MRNRPRFSIKSLLVVVTLLAVTLGTWIAYRAHEIKNLTALRNDDAIVVVRDHTPDALKSMGAKNAGPIFSVATVELYITPVGNNAIIGASNELVPTADAQKCILDKASEARSNGAKDIQLILIDSTPQVWMDFARDNSLSVILENKERYLARLKANQQSGANINPESPLKSQVSKPTPTSSALEPTPAN